jgi:hypothetical protein
VRVHNDPACAQRHSQPTSRFCDRVQQRLNIRKTKIHALPRERMHNMGRITD